MRFILFGEIFVLFTALFRKVLNFITTKSGWYVETISVDSQGFELLDAKPKLHFTCPELKVFAKVMTGRGWRLT